MIRKPLNLTNAEILNLITTSRAYYGQRVFSTDQEEMFFFTGIVFLGECSCSVIGTQPIVECFGPVNKYCQPIKDVFAEILCDGITFDPIILGDAEVDTPYNQSQVISGPPPYLISIITKPAWLNISIFGSGITFSGTPGYSDTLGVIPVTFNIGNNCSSQVVDITINVQARPFIQIGATGLISVDDTALGITSADGFRIDWGDGTIDNFIGGTVSPVHVYSTPFTGVIRLSAIDLSTITLIAAGNNITISPSGGTPITILTSEIGKLTGLQSLALNDRIYLDGIIRDLPSTLITLAVYATNLSGNMLELARTIINLAITGDNTVSGSVADLPPDLTNMNIWGANTITGDIDGIPKTVYFIGIQGFNTVSGDIANLPPILQQIGVLGLNTITGDIASLAATVIYFVIAGNNTISGNIINFKIANTWISVSGNNTITGDLGDLPVNVAIFQISGNNTLSGDVANLPPFINVLSIISPFSTVANYSSGTKTWADPMIRVYLFTQSPSFSPGAVDAMLIDLAAVTTWVSDKIVGIVGVTRTSASDAAVATLISKGVTVSITP